MLKIFKFDVFTKSYYYRCRDKNIDLKIDSSANLKGNYKKLYRKLKQYNLNAH